MLYLLRLVTIYQIEILYFVCCIIYFYHFGCHIYMQNAPLFHFNAKSTPYTITSLTINHTVEMWYFLPT